VLSSSLHALLSRFEARAASAVAARSPRRGGGGGRRRRREEEENDDDEEQEQQQEQRESGEVKELVYCCCCHVGLVRAEFRHGGDAKVWQTSFSTTCQAISVAGHGLRQKKLAFQLLKKADKRLVSN
jgi:hypothetical protein